MDRTAELLDANITERIENLSETEFSDKKEERAAVDMVNSMIDRLTELKKAETDKTNKEMELEEKRIAREEAKIAQEQETSLKKKQFLAENGIRIAIGVISAAGGILMNALWISLEQNGTPTFSGAKQAIRNIPNIFKK